jgi:hypothetical protein
MDEELRCLIEQIEKRFDSLRQADREAVELAHADLKERLSGFPAEFAKKGDVDAAKETLQRLETDAISRELYGNDTKNFTTSINKLEQEKLPKGVFETFVENYRIEQATAAQERQTVATTLAAASARSSGQTATIGQIGLVRGASVAFLTIVVIVSQVAFQ